MQRANTKGNSLSEEFYQISPVILESFPKYRPPLNYYYFNEKVNDVQLFAKKGDRLSKERQDQLFRLCKEGNIFLARSDYPIYSKHISKQLDLILQDSQLRENEIAEALWTGIPENLKTFFTQPVKLVFENILPNLLVVSEYLKKDPHKVVGLIKRIRPSNELWIQSTNVLFIGLGAYLRTYEKEINEKFLNSLTIGLSMVYLGKTKIPDYILKKKSNLTPEEEKQVIQYPLTGAGILEKHGQRDKIVLQCILEHNERLDGSGTPKGLKGSEISVPGRIAAIASAFNEMLCSLQDPTPSHIKKIAHYLSTNPRKFDSSIVNGLLTILVRI